MNGKKKKKGGFPVLGEIPKKKKKNLGKNLKAPALVFFSGNDSLGEKIFLIL